MANKVDVEGYISKKVNVLKGDKEYQGKTGAELRKIAYEELVAESCQRMLVDSKVIEKLAKKDKGLFNKLKQFITDFFNKIIARYKKLTPTSAEARLVQEIKGMSEKLQSLFEDALLDAAENHRIVGTQKNTAQSGVKFSFEGYAEDGKGKYKSNFPKGTPKKAKGERILHYIQDVWSKSPITLRMEKDGDIRYIEAHFDPDYDPSGNRLTDASKLMGGNRHGTSSEQRVTLDLADDYYKIASEANYNYSKDEVGKDIPTHEDVREWHYFVNDIYFSEFESDEYFPYRVTINVKEKSNGHFVYSFSAEKQEETSSQRTLHAVVNGETTAKGNLSSVIVPNSNKDVKQKQLEVIQKTNPAPNEYLTWVRTVDDIKTLAETLEDEDWSEGGNFTPDLSSDDIREAIERGNITVYSSYPIENAVFVSPSRMEAESYSGTGRVYEKTVDITDVAWIDPTQGMYAEVADLTESVNTKFQLKAKESAYEEAMQEYQQTHGIESVKKMVALVDEFAERSMPDSKVRDKNGKLMKVYHGTEADDFNVFDKARRGQTDSSIWGRGYYFSSDYEFAEMFGDNVRSFFLNITNPFTVSKVDAPASEIANKLIALGEKINFDYSKLKALEFAKAFGNQKFTDVLMSHGFDGVIVGDVNDECIEYATFNQNQMKLSDPITYDDSGKVIPLSERFDDSKVDIRFQKKVDSDAELTDNKSINNGGAVNGSQNTKLLGRREISADGGNYDPIWQQSESARKILRYLGFLSEEKKRNENENRTSDSRWLAPSSYMQQIEQGFANGILRDLRGVKLSGKDVIGRTLSTEVLDKLKDTIFKDENGNVIPLYHWTQNTFLEFRYGDIGFHFGTVDAAHDRYIQLKRDRADEGLETPLGKYKEVYLNIKNPLTLIDWNYQWTAGDVAMQLSDKGLITENQYNNLALTSGFYDWSYDNPAAKAVRKILSDLGYDGIIYYNQSEDIGSISAIALYPEQVIMVTDNGIPVNQNTNNNETETKNGLPEGVLKYQYKAYAVETDTELLAQHLEENAEVVSEVLRRSAKIEMKDGTMRRLVDRRLRYYGIGRELRKETTDYISAVLVAAGHPSAKGKDLTADITSTIKSALEKSSFEYNPNAEDYQEAVSILKSFEGKRVFLTEDQEAHVREQDYDLRWLRNQYGGKLNVVKKSQHSEMSEIRLDDVYAALSDRFPSVFPTQDSPTTRAVDSSEYALDILDKLDYLSRGQSLSIELYYSSLHLTPKNIESNIFVVILMNLKITDVRAHKGDSAFLIDDGKTAVLYDTGFAFTGNMVAENIKKELETRQLDYILLTHSHYDHAAGSAYILKHYPKAKVVASEYAAGVFKRPGAKRVMRDLDRKFATACGVAEYEDLFDNLTVHIPVKDGDEISAGDMKFTAVELKGHTNCCVGYYLASEKLLLSCETLGVYDGDKNIVPSYLVSFEDTLRSIEKAEQMEIDTLLLPHYGLLTDEQKDFYLKNARAASLDTYEEIKALLIKGKTKAQAVEYFKERFYSRRIKSVYPQDAMLLNTSIMVSLIGRESGIEVEE